MSRLVVAVGLCGLAAGLAAGEPTPAAGPSDSSVRTLVEQLGAEQFADRQAAEAALARLGAPAIPALQSALQSDSPEVRTRAAGLLVKIRRVAESGERLAPRRVKLDYKDIPLGTAINDLKARTGLNVALDPARVANPLRRITCETAVLPVWEALDSFCAAAGLREAYLHELEIPKSTVARRGYVPPPPAPAADAVAVTLIDGTHEKLPGVRSSAVRVLALPAAFPGHKVTLGAGEVLLCLDVTPAPGLGWQEVAGVKVTRVIDSNGRAGGAGTERDAQPQYDPNGVVFVGGGAFGGRAVAMRFDINGNPVPPESQPNPRVVPVPLKLGSDSPRSLKRLEGSVFAELQFPNQQLLAVADPARKTGTWFSAANDLRCCVAEVRESPRAGQPGFVKVQLEFPSPWAVNARRRGWNPGWPEAPRMTQGYRVEAFDAAGKPLPQSANGYNESSDDGMRTIQTFTISLPHGAGVPAKVAVVGPRPVTVEIPFALENVPLP